MADTIDWASAPEPVNLPDDHVVTSVPNIALVPVQSHAFKRKPLPSRSNPGVQAAPLSPASQSASFFSANYEANAKAAALAAVANPEDANAATFQSNQTSATSSLHPSSANTAHRASVKSAFQSVTGRNFFSNRKAVKAPSFSIQAVPVETLTNTSPDEITALPSVPSPPVTAPQENGETTPRTSGMNMARFQSGLDNYSTALKSDVKELSRMLSTTKLRISKAQSNAKWSSTPLRKRKGSAAGTTASSNVSPENVSELPEHEYAETTNPISPIYAEPITNQTQMTLPDTHADDTHVTTLQPTTQNMTHDQGLSHSYSVHHTTPSQSSDHGSIPIMLAPTPRYTMISPSTALYQQELAELPAMPVEMGISSPHIEALPEEHAGNGNEPIPTQEAPGDLDEPILQWQKTQQPAFNLVVAEPVSPVATDREEATAAEPILTHEIRKDRSLSVQSRTSQPVSVLSNLHEPHAQGSDTVSGLPSRPSTAEAHGHAKEDLKTSSHESSLGKAIVSEAKEIGRLFQVGRARLKNSDWAKSAKDETKGLSSGIGSVFKKTDPPWKRKADDAWPPKRKNEGKMIADWKY